MQETWSLVCQGRGVRNWSCVGACLIAVAFAGGIFSVSRLAKTVLFASTGCRGWRGQKAFNFIFINYCKKECAYSVHTDRSGRGGLGR